MWSSLPRLLLVVATCAASLRPVAAQQSHADMLGGMAVRCLTPVVASADSFRVTFEGAAAFIETELLRTWIDEGRTVLTGTAPEGRDPAKQAPEDDARDAPTSDERHLRVAIDEAEVHLERAGGGMLERTAHVAVTYRFQAPTGRLLAADTCRATDRNTFDADLAASLADDRYAGTNPDIPDTSRLRRIVEPVVVIGAAAVGTWLFFNLRSRRSDN